MQGTLFRPPKGPSTMACFPGGSNLNDDGLVLGEGRRLKCLLQKEGAQWEGDMATKGTDATRSRGVVLGVRTIQHSLCWR